MSYYRPAEIGMPLADVDTPALLLDLDAFEHNMKSMRDSLADRGIKLRPHAKSHKCPEIGKRQMALGAVGVCCQKVSEAEAMVDGGVGDVLIANEVVGAAKLRRVAALARRAKIAVCADHADNVAALDAAAGAAGLRLDVLVEINVGANRCGVEAGEPALLLAQQISAGKHLRFAGLQAYQGSAQHLRGVPERRAAMEGAGPVRRLIHLRTEHIGPDEMLVAAKRYRGAEHRMFHRDAGYTEGRRVRKSRERRALARRTEFGR